MSQGRRESWLAAASGLALGVAFLPLPLAPLAWVAFVPLLGALEQRIAGGASARSLFGLGTLAGLVFFLVGTHWIALLSDVALTVPWIKYLAWVLAAAYLSLFWGLAVWLAGVLARRAGVPARWTFVVAMVVVEELRGSGELGFPWFQPGYTQHAVLPVLQLAGWGSVSLVTAWVLGVNGAVRHALTGGRARGPLLAAILLVPLANPAAWSVLRAPRSGVPPGALRVLLVQGNVPGEIKWSGKHQLQILDHFLALSDSAVRLPAPGRAGLLVVWPETATGSYLRKQVDQAVAVAEFAARTGAPVFTGYADYHFDPAGQAVPSNAAGLFVANDGLPESYAKRHLVPFGERMPFEWLIPALGKLDFGQAEWEAGTRSVRFPSAAGPFSTLICFESIFPSLARADVRAGARWLVNITNDEWFGNGAALQQHANMAPFRAVENAVPLLRCANTGLTCAIDASGRVTARLPVFAPGVLVAELDPSLPARWRPTPFVRLGDWPLVLSLLCVVAWLVPRSRRVAR